MVQHSAFVFITSASLSNLCLYDFVVPICCLKFYKCFDSCMFFKFDFFFPPQEYGIIISLTFSFLSD